MTETKNAYLCPCCNMIWSVNLQPGSGNKTELEICPSCKPRPELTETERMSLFTTPEAVSLDEEEHQKYYVGKTEVIGTTRISGREVGFLTNWANDLGVKGVDVRRFLTHSANIGTLVHRLNDAHDSGNGFETKPEYAPYLMIAHKCHGFYLNFRRDYDFKPILNEKALVSKRYKYGGTIDLYGLLGGCRILIDFKTSTSIFDSHKLQMAAYENLLAENGYGVDKVFSLRLPRDGDKYFFSQTHQVKFYFNRFLNHLSNYEIEQIQKSMNQTAEEKLEKKNALAWVKKQKR